MSSAETNQPSTSQVKRDGVCSSRSQPVVDVGPEAHAITEVEGSAAWRPIATAPKDQTIVVWHEHASDPYFEEGSDRLTVYGAHTEGLCTGKMPDGVYMAQWGGEWDDFPDGFIPAWWFVLGSDWEKPLAPTHWQPLSPPGDREAVVPRDAQVSQPIRDEHQ